ncbi:hypothetical protein WA026_018767 [Henosepilachna vigintioctopunctata]|uniref:NADH dehydrogenase [ubiquinone] 1 beta subcomplex subunit 8, mitochondrial n=1 Tax=Henosepilachna vigintioctopunctata TaxID=420089 RepID=A0AAW1TW85_9CUCU
MSSSQIFKCYNRLSRLPLNNSNSVLVTSVRNHWNKDYKPGPFPKTEAERLAAAKKYDMHPSEYAPYNDDGTGFGDYPKFKAQSAESKDPNYPWDFPEFKRNFNEPLHVQFDLFREDRYDINYRPNPSCKVQFAQYIGVMSLSFLIYWLCDQVKGFLPAVPKQYPGVGKKHYTFD